MFTISSAVIEAAERHPAKTVSTRFVPPTIANEATGMWRNYYRKCDTITLEQMDRRLVNVVQ